MNHSRQTDLSISGTEGGDDDEGDWGDNITGFYVVNESSKKKELKFFLRLIKHQ